MQLKLIILIAFVFGLVLNSQGVTYTVTSSNDSGAGSLRDAITQANSNPGADVIAFSIPGSGPHVILLNSELPHISEQLFIDGYSEPDYSYKPVISLNGTTAGAGVDGLTVDSDLCSIVGLSIVGFSNNGIQINDDNTFIEGCYIGLSMDGSTAIPNGNDGVSINNSSGIQIGGTDFLKRNFISGNSNSGIHIEGSGSFSIEIKTSAIGLNESGMSAVPNVLGIEVEDNANDILIGSLVPHEGNIISGNNSQGISITNTPASNIHILNNFIGTNPAGDAAIANGEGIHLQDAQNVTIELNLISGNSASGIGIYDALSHSNLIIGNFIGVGADGVSNLGNGSYGVLITNGSNSNVIGGSSVSDRNILSFNLGGVFIGASTFDNIVSGNFIGTDLTGLVDCGNTADGVYLSTTSSNTIGGVLANEGNVISGNDLSEIFMWNSDQNIISGNKFGLGSDGLTAIPGNLNSVEVRASSSDNVFGYDTSMGTVDESLVRNYFHNSNRSGILFDETGTGNRVSRNSFSNNADLGIDLNNDGVTPNDVNDSDTGPND